VILLGVDSKEKALPFRALDELVLFSFPYCLREGIRGRVKIDCRITRSLRSLVILLGVIQKKKP
jgi:hypothetical protein